jgi:hypothetical protein
MGSLERKLARRQEKEAKKLEKKLMKKLNMFEGLPESCLACEAPYDKKNKEQAATWNVVIKKENINLYCPDCWSKALNVVKEFKEKNEGHNTKRI